VRWVVMLLAVAAAPGFAACSYPKQKLEEWKRDFQKEVQRQAAAPKTPEEACQRQGGVLHNEQCYTPSAASLDENSCRLRGGLYLDTRCLLSAQKQAGFP